MSTEAAQELNTLPNQETDMFAKAWGEFNAHRALREASSRLHGVKRFYMTKNILSR